MVAVSVVVVAVVLVVVVLGVVGVVVDDVGLKLIGTKVVVGVDAELELDCRICIN